MHLKTLLVCLAACAVVLAACDSRTTAPTGGDAGGQPITTSADVCEPGGIAPAAFSPAGKLDDTHAILPNGRMVAPEGRQVPVRKYPHGLAVSADGSKAYVLHVEGGVLVVDLETGETLQAIDGVEGIRGIALTPDGQHLWFTNATTGRVYRYDVTEAGLLENEASIHVDGFMVDLRVHPDGTKVYALANSNSNIYEIDAESLAVLRTMRAGMNPFAMTFDAEGETLFASNLGGDSLSIIDLTTGETAAILPICGNPEGLAFVAETKLLYVACSNSDALAIIDTETRTVTGAIDLTGEAAGLTGGAVNEVAYAPGANRLFVSAARRNKVDIVALPDGTVEGSIATGHYPTAIWVSPDGARLVVAAAKGFGSEDSRWDIRPHLNVIDVPQTTEELATATQRVRDNNSRPGTFFPEECGGELPPALRGGPDKPIKHVVFIARENKTYDNVLGDLEGANGDPNLAIFGEEITPNIHALARQFTNLDNFYADAEHSLQGHQWITQADCNDYTEKMRLLQIPIEGFDPAAKSGGGSVFEHCYANGVSFRNYGQIVGFAEHMIDDFAPFIDHKYPFFNMSIPDTEKAREFIRELEQGIFPEFVYIQLPNDHTQGKDVGAPLPEWMIGDNDQGTGMIIEAISNSPFWPETLVLIFEDDPQSSGDHVHSHRSIFVAVSPHVRRGYVSSVQYSTASFYKTMEMVLELPPINRNTAEAPPMADIFVTDTPGDEPDFAPYTALANPVEFGVNQPDEPGAKESAAIDWSQPDNAPGLGMILWKAMRGDEPLPDYAKYIED